MTEDFYTQMLLSKRLQPQQITPTKPAEVQLKRSTCH